MAKKLYRKIKAGYRGTKHLVKKYGEKLICVRYVYDPEKNIKMKTVELVEEIENWTPNRQNIPWNKIMHIKVEYGEKYIGQLIRSSGGTWNKSKKYWELNYREVIALGLESRIINN